MTSEYFRTKTRMPQLEVLILPKASALPSRPVGCPVLRAHPQTALHEVLSKVWAESLGIHAPQYRG